MSEAEIRERLEAAVRPAFQDPFDPAADLARGRRRRRRNRVVGGTASCAALALAVALIAPALPSRESGGPADSGFDGSGPTYVEYGTSVIHDGDREIDVSPYGIAAFVKTDDGFVFQTPVGKVFFADGTTVEEIGLAHADNVVVSDDSGSYVAWVEPSLVTVVYDTSRGVEVLRQQIRNGFAGLDIDGDVVYLRQMGGGAVVAWDIGAGESDRLSSALWDVSDGYLGRMYFAAPLHERTTRVVVSRDPDAAGPRVPALEGVRSDGEPADLSPDGRYVLGDTYPRHVVIERASQADVTPEVDERYRIATPGYWIDDDRYVLEGYETRVVDPARPPDLLVCSVSAGTCELAAEPDDWYMFPGTAIP
jgi:hypothetical protein